MRALLCAFVILCSGCTTPPTVFSSAPSAKVFSQDIVLDYMVSFTNLKTQKSQTLITHLEITPRSTAFIGLGPLGGTLFECKQTSQDIACQSINQAISAETFFADMQLIYWPQQTLQRNLQPNYTLEDHKLTRNLYYGNNLVSAIQYSGQSKWDADVMFINTRHSYRLDIHPLHAKVSK